MKAYDPNYVHVKSYALVGQKAIICCEGKILVLQRSEKAGGRGKWSLPGGGLDHGEDPLESIKREIQEETQLELDDIKPFSVRSYIDDKDFIVIIGYQAHPTNQKKVVLNWEHDAYRWVTKEEALQLTLSEDARYFISSL